MAFTNKNLGELKKKKKLKGKTAARVCGEPPSPGKQKRKQGQGVGFLSVAEIRTTNWEFAVLEKYIYIFFFLRLEYYFQVL
jgi:hypothetical protein